MLDEEVRTPDRARSALLDRLLRQPRKEIHRELSLAQLGLWFFDRLMPGSPLYSIPFTVRLAGRLDPACLARALNGVVARHETLRSRFDRVDGRPMQIVLPELEVPLPSTDLRHLAPDERAEAAERLAREEARSPFDLAKGPLLRARLLRVGDEEHVLLLNLHHLVFDGGSMGVLFRELAALYAAALAGSASPLPPLPIQYGDFAVWQREQLGSSAPEAQLAYWRERLAGAPVRQDLPSVGSRPPSQRFVGATLTAPLRESLLAPLQDLARRERATPFMVLLAAFDVLLSRRTGSEDVVVGAPVAGRTRPELGGLIGYFVNTLPLRVDLSGDPTFRTLLGRVRRSCLDAYAHQDLTLDRLVEELRPERDLARNPFFQVLFTCEDDLLEGVEMPGIRVGAPEDVGTGTSKLDVTWQVKTGGGRWRVAVEYSTDLFDAASVERMVDDYRMILEAVAADPDVPVSALLPEIPPVPAAERPGPAPVLLWEMVPPRTPAEEVISGIWCELLGIDEVSVTHDRFFEIGGHSLLATQVVTRLEEAFGVEVPLRHLFEAPTVAALAEVVTALIQAELDALPDDVVAGMLTATEARR